MTKIIEGNTAQFAAHALLEYYSVRPSKKPRQGVSLTSINLYGLTKNLTAQSAHLNYVVLPWKEGICMSIKKPLAKDVEAAVGDGQPLAECVTAQLENPYRFIVDKLIVNIEFVGGKTCTEALADALAAS